MGGRGSTSNRAEEYPPGMARVDVAQIRRDSERREAIGYAVDAVREYARGGGTDAELHEALHTLPTGTRIRMNRWTGERSLRSDVRKAADGSWRDSLNEGVSLRSLAQNLDGAKGVRVDTGERLY